ncbi:MAG TPA: CHASE domain-containing protein [Phycisphaerae bacterium]|nr:CHASE domain-containing protein [Phycisphaerae bacterium]HOJ72698.1 CHASE domain-containing protein [Phycisphaerae bacterium]HOM53670.1 CHASE domain-containing protein [Phycisphaerae bacterium]HON65628.1 CHASE domain-containing protein [Phycisphaerae bacterium]HPP24879.1 CHASE domain-containing protein [Phycisphaerae bacterium]
MPRHWPVLVILVVGLTISQVVFTWARWVEQRDQQLIFEREVGTQTNAIRATLEAYLSKVSILADYLHSLPEVTQEKFRVFSSAMLARRPAIVALEWAPRVPADQREAFEERMRQAGFPEYRIKELRVEGAAIPATDRPAYFPIQFVEPLELNEAALGVDMGHRAGAAEAFAAAATSGELRASLAIRLIQREARWDGILAFMPVYRRDHSPDLEGVAAGVFQIAPMVAEALAVFENPALALAHAVYLQTGPDQYQRVAPAPSTSLADVPETLSRTDVADLQGKRFRDAVEFSLGGQSWLVVSEPLPGALEPMRSRMPLAVFLVGFLVTWIVAGYFWLLINRAVEIERTVEERTSELARANLELRQENAARLAAEQEVLEALAKEREAREAAQQAQEELGASEARYRTMGETIPYGVWLADPSGRPQYFSRSFLELLDMNMEETLDWGWTRRLPPEEVETTLERMREAIQSGTPFEIELRILGPDKEYHTVLVRGLPVRNSAGRITSWVGMNLDITERKLAEEELRQHRDYLEELVRSRTLELMIANEELRNDIEQREKVEEALRILQENLEEQVKTRTAELAAANRELEAFSYSVSHDLRAPLRHIAGFVQLLQKQTQDQLSESSRRHLQVIAQAANRMGKLIDDLLQFSRMGRSAMRITSVSVASVVEDVCQELQGDLGETRVEWIIHPDLPRVQADPALLRVVLGNLLSNALKYSRTRETPRIEVGAVDSGTPDVTIFVRDNGVGFDMQYADRLFGVFQRLHKAEDFEGTGIGLAIVQRIIHRHGGKVWAEGAPDQGATFYFSLPQGKELDARVEAHTAG